MKLLSLPADPSALASAMSRLRLPAFMKCKRQGSIGGCIRLRVHEYVCVCVCV